MIVYADVLFLINFAVNYLLLYLTAKMGRLRPGNLRLLSGAVIGAFYAVFMFFPRLSFGYSALAKFIFSLLVNAVTFNIRGIRLYIKTICIFYLVTCALGGGVMAIFFFTGAGAELGAVVKNGVLYMNLPWKTLIFAVCGSYFLIRIVWGVLQNKMNRETLSRKVGIFLDGREVWINALLDTGNALCEPFSGAPVIVAELDCLRSVLPEDFIRAFEDGYTNVDEIMDEKMKGRIRVIPFSSLGTEHGMMVGFRPDKAKIIDNEKIQDVGDVIVGIYTKRLAQDRSYGALLPPELVTQ